MRHPRPLPNSRPGCFQDNWIHPKRGTKYDTTCNTNSHTTVCIISDIYVIYHIYNIYIIYIYIYIYIICHLLSYLVPCLVPSRYQIHGTKYNTVANWIISVCASSWLCVCLQNYGCSTDSLTTFMITECHFTNLVGPCSSTGMHPHGAKNMCMRTLQFLIYSI